MADKRLSGMKVLIVVAPEQFRDEELFVPRDILQREGAHVVVSACRKGQAKGMLGGSVLPDILVSEARAADYDAVIVVGGMGSPEYLWHDRDLHRLIVEMAGAGKVVSAICLSGAVLALAGVLAGKKATVWPMAESLAALDKGGAAYKKEHVVQDGRIVTADGPEAAQAFGQAIADEMARSGSRV